MKHQHHSQIDSDGLQADVMRFMAIIAFCLIAILALVKDLEPASDAMQENAERKDLKNPVVMKLVEPVQDKKIVLPVPVMVMEEPEAKLARPINRIKSVDLPEPPVLKKEKPLVSLTGPEPVQQESSAQQQENSAEKQVETGLQLRFASDRVFLSLIAAGKIQVYQQSVLGLRSLTPGFQVRSGGPSGTVYQLMEQSVPMKVVSIFRPSVESATYLVGLPAATSQQIQAQVNTTIGGTLVIQKNGKVIHET